MRIRAVLKFTLRMALACTATLRVPAQTQRPSHYPEPHEYLGGGYKSTRASGVCRAAGEGRLEPAPSTQPEGGLIDPQLMPGFPVQTYDRGGTYHGGPVIHVLLANLDDDPQPEMITSGLAIGPLYAWNMDGSMVAGWPLPSYGALAIAGSPCSAITGRDQIVYADEGNSYLHWEDGDGTSLPGWPRHVSNGVQTPPSILKDQGGRCLVFTEEQDWRLHGYDQKANVLTGWPTPMNGINQEFHTPAIADLNDDGASEIMSVPGGSSAGGKLLVYELSGAYSPGFPFTYPENTADTFPAVGDVTGDHLEDIVLVSRKGTTYQTAVYILDRLGRIEYNWYLDGDPMYGTAPALGDLDGDGIPEIVIQTDEFVGAYRADGSSLAGWPVLTNQLARRNSSPVIGDIDGDGAPDVALEYHRWYYGGNDSEAWALNRSGVQLVGFPKLLPMGYGGVPAIADLRADGGRQVIYIADYWDGYAGYHDKLWAFDLHGAGYGPIQWGMFGGGAAHTGHFISRISVRVSESTVSWTRHDAATGYDVVKGDLSLLHASGGNFAVSTSSCLCSKCGAQSVADPLLASGTGSYFYLVRAATFSGRSSYDEAIPQVGARDGEIGASGHDCP